MSSSRGVYLPSLDGIRAVAVIIVFFSHAGWDQLFPGGMGVTIFFFLSGYLITTILRLEYEDTGAISLKNFYLRRIYRILPPMYLVLLVVLALWKIGIFGGNVSIAGVAAESFQVTNYYLLFAKEPAIAPGTPVLWSLAVEEHFYLIFPAFFILCLRRWSYPSVAKLFLTICLLVALWRCVLVVGFNPSSYRTFWATDTRLDSILFGCLMGIWMNPALDKREPFPKSKIFAYSLALTAVFLLLFTLIYRNAFFRETIRYTLQSIALFPLFWLAVRHSKFPVFQPLNLKPMRFIGLISYTFYLCHSFIIDLTRRILEDKILVALFAFVMSILFSALVYYLIEIPFARLRRQLHKPRAETIPAINRNDASKAVSRA